VWLMTGHRQGTEVAMNDPPTREPHMGPRCEWCEQPFQEGEEHHAGIDCVQALQRRHEPRREPRMGPRCEWCGCPFQEGEDHHERMDCIQALRRCAELRERQQKADWLARLRLAKLRAESYGPLQAIADAAWDCFHLADSAARLAAADRLATALARWKGRNQPRR
jgi:hypothetical protein